MSTPTDNDRLRELLRRADPVRHEQPLSPVELGRLRANAASVPESRRPVVRWQPAFGLVAAAGFAVLALMAWPWAVPPSEGPAAVSAGPTAPALTLGARVPLGARQTIEPRAADLRHSRELHFTAPNGTRIVWNVRSAPRPDGSEAGTRS